jgi:hypothetical protein
MVLEVIVISLSENNSSGGSSIRATRNLKTLIVFAILGTRHKQIGLRNEFATGRVSSEWAELITRSGPLRTCWREFLV